MQGPGTRPQNGSSHVSGLVTSVWPPYSTMQCDEPLCTQTVPSSLEKTNLINSFVVCHFCLLAKFSSVRSSFNNPEVVRFYGATTIFSEQHTWGEVTRKQCFLAAVSSPFTFASFSLPFSGCLLLSSLLLVIIFALLFSSSSSAFFNVLNCIIALLGSKRDKKYLKWRSITWTVQFRWLTTLWLLLLYRTFHLKRNSFYCYCNS